MNVKSQEHYLLELNLKQYNLLIGNILINTITIKFAHIISTKSFNS